MLGYFSPLIAVEFMVIEDDSFVLFRPRLFINERIEVIVPALAALFARSPCQLERLFHLRRYYRPLLDSELLYEFPDRVIFLRKINE